MLNTSYSLYDVLTRSSNIKVYELPTDELCTVLSKLVVGNTLEVGAGNGLLTARLKKFLNKNNIIIASTKVFYILIQYCE